ncbi:hypothetical protein [Carboxylicivirga marina]|uniref:DUF2116 family Zn-ribbon domain-containing protein n=1 Tax=Carboxylicivirga marina TaxID=2800988 RepID=A0ABS1HQG2_9BACT|nr:hypothetical protein [Carboxylicivirga marina]MBK3519924.1 hypothetical protein [Carboxylicivirga marina]
MSNCPYCHEIIQGRSDKKFCSPYCKSAYHYQQNKSKPDSLFNTIDRQLKTNRRLLKSYNKAGKSTVRKDLFLSEGFSPKYFTHYWKSQKGSLYLFCYEFGFMEVKEHNATKYILVTWQAYMD